MSENHTQTKEGFIPLQEWGMHVTVMKITYKDVIKSSRLKHVNDDD